MPGYSEYFANASRSGEGEPLRSIDYERLERLRAPSLQLLREFESDGKVSDVKEFEFLQGLGYTCEINGANLVACFIGPVWTDNSADVSIRNSPEKPGVNIGQTGEEVFRFRHLIPASVEEGNKYQIDLFEFIKRWVRDRKPGTG